MVTKSFTHTAALAAAFGIALLASSAQAATVVNVNFSNIKDEATLFGPIGTTGETWNQAVNAKLDTDLTDSAGAATTIDWSLSGTGWTSGNWGTSNIDLLESAFYVSDGNSRTLTLSGLDAGKTYDLYIATFDQNNWGASSMTFSTTNTTTTVGSQVASSDTPTSWVINDNYVVFEGLVPNGSNEIAISGVRSTGSYGFWNGFQLVAVPEPSAALFGVFGVLALLRRRRA